MGISLSGRYIVGLNLLLIALLAYCAALTADDIVALRFSGPSAPEFAAERVAGPAAVLNHPRSYYDTIARRDVFNLTPQTAAAPAPVVSESLPIKLLGTSLLTLAKPFVIIQDANSNQALYRLGDEIPGAGKLVEIRKDSAVIDHQGHRVLIEMPQEPIGAPAATGREWSEGRSRIEHPAGQGVRRVGGNQYVVERTTVDQSLQNMAQLFTEIRAVPNIENGTSNGFKLSEIQPGSIFQQIGLRDGDVLTSVEGQSVSDPARAMQLLSSLSNRQSISLSVLRDGRPLSFQYAIR
jgi:general secretion pathway protein C